MIIRDNFVILNLLKTGSSFLYEVLKKLHNT